MSEEKECKEVEIKEDDPIRYVLDQDCCKDVQKPCLRIGMTAKVTAAGDQLRLRDAPGLKSGKIKNMSTGTEVAVECGPVCLDDIVWWRVKQGRQRGWSAEGEKEQYYLTASETGRVG